MTVYDLIKELVYFDPNKEVVLQDGKNKQKYDIDNIVPSYDGEEVVVVVSTW